VECPTCRGTGLERVYEPWNDCQECDGAGTVWGDDDPTRLTIEEEDAFLYTVPIGSPLPHPSARG
jgi:RecJ-like exonuclease